MPRRKFLQDLEQTRAHPSGHITDIQRYEADDISLRFWYHRGGTKHELGLKLISTNVEEYPEGNQFILFTEDTDVEREITDTFPRIQTLIDGLPIPSALQQISDVLCQELSLNTGENFVYSNPDCQRRGSPDLEYHLNERNDLSCNDENYNDYDDDDDFDDENYQYDDDATFGLEEPSQTKDVPQISGKLKEKRSSVTMTDVQSDLRAVKTAGFKVGVYGDLLKSGIVCVSIRIAKLGISEEAMQAWGLLPNQYLVLLINFSGGYKFVTHVLDENALSAEVQMHVGVSDTYKPRRDEAFAVFSLIDDEVVEPVLSQSTQPLGLNPTGKLKALFIGRPLNDLLRNRFAKILSFRQRFDLSWGQAERVFDQSQGVALSMLLEDIRLHKHSKEAKTARALPDIVMADALSKQATCRPSLPLVTMQFVLRHLVRCTEFCLVCHCRIENDFEALKPYVCSNPLCLYQLQTLGFGPTTEWEILAQPHVVDLLISFCYLQASALRMQEFPLGVTLKVPLLPHFRDYKVNLPQRHPTTVQTQDDQSHLPEPEVAFKAILNLEQKLLTTIPSQNATTSPVLKTGDWIALVGMSRTTFICHVCIKDALDTHLLLDTVTPCIRYDHNGFGMVPVLDRQTSSIKNPLPLSEQCVKVDCYLYSSNMNDLPEKYRQCAIVSLLNTLPPVSEIWKDLDQQQKKNCDAELNHLRKKCPPAALGLLRWIIASNRSCIMQVDKIAAGQHDTQLLTPSEDRVSGMDDWMQFRFAQGAPDKEQRFMDCVRTNVKARNASARYPTLFAWHGSPLYNWHSIVRQGLNFKEIAHGRSSGNGVYMSPSVNTSTHYSAHTAGMEGWPNSALKITSVVSLQEVVNAPVSFVSCSPHLVVADNDWIQTRYLFVKTTGVQHSIGSVSKAVYQQDPRQAARGTLDELITIPITAISKSRQVGVKSTYSPGRKRKITMVGEDGQKGDMDDGVSVVTEVDDRDLLDPHDAIFDHDVLTADSNTIVKRFASSNESKNRNRNRSRGLVIDRSKTDFVPGTLDTTGIRLLVQPVYASVPATTTLMRAFNDTIKVQASTLLHDLGWYIDPDNVVNVYQWIVELHSFDKTLPLAQDMKKAGITSIVLEMRFTNDFPCSPPFIRVIKPRFLDPLSGGGGHITSGGAICMELLTSTGWLASCSIESVLLQIRLTMSERERPARLLRGPGGFQNESYAIGEALAAYKRFCQRHGWMAPKGLDQLGTT